MEFSKYNSIDNSYRKATIDQIFLRGHSGGEWVVTEKVHGSNLSYIIQGQDVQCAKRTSILKDGEGFFQWEYLYDKMIGKLHYLYTHLCDVYNLDNPVIHVYGEYMGGNYTHPDVKPINTLSQIQRGMSYTPDHEFYGFDIKINGEYMDFDPMCEAFETCGFIYAKPLFRGTFEECLSYNCEYNSTIPDMLGLPAIEDNVCEGNIVRPVTEKKLTPDSRVILKNKNDKWSEKVHKPKKKKNTQPTVPLADHLVVYCNKIDDYITENRLRNVISKEGQITDKMFGKLMGKFNGDVIEEFIGDNPDFTELPKTDRKRITSYVAINAKELIQRNFVNIIDGTF